MFQCATMRSCLVISFVIFSLFAVVASLVPTIPASKGHATSCGCKDESLCQPLPRNLNKFEFVGFLVNQSPSVYKNLDWTKITTVVVNSISNLTHELVCYARARKTKVMILTDIATADLVSAAKRTAFVNKTVSTVVNNNLDGINMDFEGNISPEGTESRMLTSVMQSLRTELSKKSNDYTLSMDYVFCAACIVGRTYEYLKLANIIDYFVIMEYDMQGARYQRIGGTNLCYVLSNSPFPTVRSGVEDFIKRGVPAEKLVLAFPWYGYYDPCEKFDVVTQRCYTNCSNKDSGMRQLCFDAISSRLIGQSEAGRQWNVETLTPSFTYIYQEKLQQINYDDSWSLRIKYNYAVARKLRGCGAWHLNCLDYSNSTIANADRKMIWDVIPPRKD